MKKIGVLLVNLGTPDSPSVPDVRKYLREFLMDRRVIDINPVSRFMLINGIIAPFRAPKSAHEYKKLWTKDGSPLKFYGYRLEKLVQEALGNEYEVCLAMRYQSPSVGDVLKKKMEGKGLSKIIVLPLYPQYASASTGSTIECVMDEIKNWELIPDLHIISTFVEDELFNQSFINLGKKYMSEDKYDHILFTFHGLPERQILKSSVNNHCQLGKCCNTYNNNNRHCYRAQCFHTARVLAKGLNLTEDQYTVSFQSRLGKTPWIHPYTDEIISELAKKGIKKVLAFSPSFISDCLETTIEIGETYKEQFIEEGGEKWVLVESLNENADWVKCIKNMVEKYV